MTTQLAIGALVLGMLLWLLSAYVLKKIESEYDALFSILFGIGITLTAVGFFYFLPITGVSRIQEVGNMILYLCFFCGYLWLTQKIVGPGDED